MVDNRGNESNLIISYLTLRKLFGILGVLLPFVMVLGGFIFFQETVQKSISSYYYTGMRDVFVGILCAMGVFLISYHGYGRVDSIAGKLGGLFALGIAFFPTTPEAHASSTARIIGMVHYASAALFFLTIAYFSLFLFTKTNPEKEPTLRKKQRNMVYRISGWTILVCLALIAINGFSGDGSVIPEEFHPVFWLETIANLAFGISWIVKGEALLKDIGK